MRQNPASLVFITLLCLLVKEDSILFTRLPFLMRRNLQTFILCSVLIIAGTTDKNSKDDRGSLAWPERRKNLLILCEAPAVSVYVMVAVFSPVELQERVFIRRITSKSTKMPKERDALIRNIASRALHPSEKAMNQSRTLSRGIPPQAWLLLLLV